MYYKVNTTQSLAAIHHPDRVDPLPHYSHFPTLISSGNHQSVPSLSLWVCLPFILLVCFVFYFYITQMSKIIRYLFFSIWLISFSIIPSSSLHVVANAKIFSFYIVEMYSIISIPISIQLFIYPSIHPDTTFPLSIHSSINAQKWICWVIR